MPALQDSLVRYNIVAKKSLGQHFLFDLNISRKIVRQAGALDGAKIFEIGPGPGALTRGLLLEGANDITSIEFDRRFIDMLQPLVHASCGAFKLYHYDAKKINYEAFFSRNLNADVLNNNETSRLCHATSNSVNCIKIIANLPYNIGNFLLVKWLKLPHMLNSMTIMLQAEVAEKLVAETGSKQFGRISVLAQLAWQARIVMHLPPQVFVPRPKVYSHVIHFEPLQQLQKDFPYQCLERVTAAAFSQRRKILYNSLKPVFGDNVAAVCEDAGIDPNHRAENVTPTQYGCLAHALLMA